MNTPPFLLPFFQALRELLAWGIRGGWAFFFFLWNVEMQINTISLFMCLSPQSLHFAWGIQRSLLPRSAIPWQGAGSHVQSPLGRSLMKLAN